MSVIYRPDNVSYLDVEIAPATNYVLEPEGEKEVFKLPQSLLGSDDIYIENESSN
jgi:hypothetical protein